MPIFISQNIDMKFTLLSFICFVFSFNIIKAQNEFITTWKPSNIQNPIPDSPPYISSSTQAWAPFRGTGYTIFWEEVGYPSHNMTMANVSSSNQVLLDFGTPHNPIPGNATYKVKVSNGSGNFYRIAFRDNTLIGNMNDIMGDSSKILEINQWGSIAWSSMGSAFSGCTNLNMLAIDSPNLMGVSDMSYMFQGCSTLSGNTSFNNWNISSVTSLLGTFSGCYLFNQPIGNWNTSNVQSMAALFLMAQNFNQPIGNWNTSQVSAMDAMFNSAKNFNQAIGNWNVSNVLEMEFMFANAWAFNQPLESWNTSQVTEMNGMFLFAKAFNQPIGSWNISKVTKLQNMFTSAIVFNQPIGNWNTSNATSMSAMFQNATSFNQNISNWNTSQVTSIQNMFTNATIFNQNLGNWNLFSLLYAGGVFNNSGLSCQNYDSTLYGWSIHPQTPNNINLNSASPLIYTHPAAVNARNFLITTKGWTIAGDSYDDKCESILSTKEITAENQLLIYPNPASDYVYIKNLKGRANYKFFDNSGRLILQNSSDKNKINIRTLTKGNYFLLVETKDMVKTFKILKN
ncbi:hypothetical protein B0A70_00160 [Chryseobacterium piscicola]|uniref:Secretion system C-terminal sorting domain-containing protein n=2 Tax=Chryseobacterium piscicola TaxID=551459 RepID=A0A2S7KJ97_9FLAO|nr:hypothetical protein B0A70_00160 [Chryseobacterium piscicola]